MIAQAHFYPIVAEEGAQRKPAKCRAYKNAQEPGSDVARLLRRMTLQNPGLLSAKPEPSPYFFLGLGLGLLGALGAGSGGACGLGFFFAGAPLPAMIDTPFSVCDG